ncbi:MAG TPA: hypothetical protein VE439_02760 [Anaerolineae bacterium]|jgi:hypothetical protein|nr:hypothetical protein [Anaerolineae bacterium]
MRRAILLIASILLSFLLIVGCSTQEQVAETQSAKSNKVGPLEITVKPNKPKESKSPEFETVVQTVWMPVGPNLTKTTVRHTAYQGYSYAPVDCGKEFNLADLNYVGSHEGVKFYARKGDKRMPPLNLWAQTSQPRQRSGTYFFGLYVRELKVDKKRLNIIRSDAENSDMRLSIEMPKQKYLVGKHYPAEILLTNFRTTEQDLIFDAVNTFELVILDKDNNVVWTDGRHPDYLGDYTMKVAAGETYTQSVSFKADTPGTYRVFCHFAGGAIQLKEPGGTIKEVQPRLKTEQITITVK